MFALQIYRIMGVRASTLAQVNRRKNPEKKASKMLALQLKNIPIYHTHINYEPIQTPPSFHRKNHASRTAQRASLLRTWWKPI